MKSPPHGGVLMWGSGAGSKADRERPRLLRVAELHRHGELSIRRLEAGVVELVQARAVGEVVRVHARLADLAVERAASGRTRDAHDEVEAPVAPRGRVFVLHRT